MINARKAGGGEIVVDGLASQWNGSRKAWESRVHPWMRERERGCVLERERERDKVGKVVLY